MIGFLVELLIAFALVCVVVCYSVCVAGGQQSRAEEAADFWTEREP